MAAEQRTDLVTDVVLEGGGVKGLALAGAVEAIGRAGYSFARVGGSSAGAIVGAVLAAMQRADEPIDRLGDIARTLDLQKFRDRGFPGRFLGPLAFLADGLSLLVEDGAYEGDYLRRWLTGVLREFDVSTFGDLRTEDPGDDGGTHHRYRLVVTASDISRKRLVYLPWQYDEYGLDPDEQRVTDAVRASASIPFFFEPVTLRGRHGSATLVDGGLVSNYPITMFDREDDQQPRWPTIGVRLDALDPDPDQVLQPVRGPVALGISLVATAIEACQAQHVLEPCNVARSIPVDTADVDPVDFDISEVTQDRLRHEGARAAETFLATWDFQKWLGDCRPAVTPADAARRRRTPTPGAAHRRR